MTNYFSHDFSARNDIKLQQLVMEMDYQGLGWYWCIVEILYEQNGRIELKQCKSIAFALHADEQKINQLISLVFEKDEKYFWSETILKRLRKQKDISEKRKKFAKDMWKNKAKISSTDVKAKAEHKHSLTNAIKEKKIKVNKRKEKDIDIESTPQILDDEKFRTELKEKFPDKNISLEIEKMKDWLASNGKKKRDYKAFARNWVRNENFSRSNEKSKVAVIGEGKYAL